MDSFPELRSEAIAKLASLQYDHRLDNESSNIPVYEPRYLHPLPKNKKYSLYIRLYSRIVFCGLVNTNIVFRINDFAIFA
jgi:hypothetical protein